ncbi:hypothetical protein EKG37_05790 [Robertmurraya yapensis]|uniref:Uncharacterized protein n=2 Tax=Bacillaceae TaxID=186817 RepID=A0A3S0IJ84_9BACI|nr:hypothetical protein [Bacillus yapensis]RTR35391.1 hypothetical protein EKG37_05790 [Bacillus yapensis]TKS97900.1 hypothetical protein FAR12_05790 [Bacillus yapensis]
MTAFKGLYIKDLKLSFNGFIIGLFLIFFAMIASFALKEYFAEPSIPAIVSFIIIVLHVFYLPANLFTSLQVEAQSQLWLHNPNRGWKLFLAKIAAGITYFVASLLVSIILVKVFIVRTEYLGEFIGLSEMLSDHLYIMAGGMFLSSIYFTVWLLFYWTLYHALKRIPILNQIRWFVLLIVWLSVTILGNLISKIPAVQDFKEMGTINFHDFTKELGENTIFPETAELHLTSIIISILITVGVFLTSVWILERKVEV